MSAKKEHWRELKKKRKANSYQKRLQKKRLQEKQNKETQQDDRRVFTEGDQY